MVKLSGVTDSVRIVAGAKEENVVTGNLCNFFDLVHSFRIFNLQNNKPLVISLTVILCLRKSAVYCIRITAVYRPAADGIEAGHVDNLSCILSGHNVRRHNAGGIQFQRTNIIAIGTAGYPTENIGVINFTGHNLCFGYSIVVGRMFHIHPDTGDAEKSRHFNNTGVGTV